MRLVHSAPNLVEFRGRAGARAPLLVGVVLVLGPTLATLFAPPPITADRITAAALVAAVAAGLIALGWPRRNDVRLRPDERTLQLGDATPSELGLEPVFHLVAAPSSNPTGPARYGLRLERRDGDPVLLLSAENPATTLRELSVIRELLPLPVVAGWGLPTAGPPWVDRVRTDGGVHDAAPVLRDDSTDRPAQRRIATTLLVGAAVVTGLLIMKASERIALGDAASPVSVTLPILAIIVVVVTGTGMGSGGTRLTVGADLVFERRIWGFSFARRSVAKTAIRHAYVVAPIATAPNHLLLDTVDGPLAFPCDASVGATILAELARPS